MAKNETQPTAAEWEILEVLWNRGPSTVREVYEYLAKDTGYTTALKLLQIMTDKGFVKREESGRAHIYRAALDQQNTQGSLVKRLLRQAFGGSTAKLVMSALSAKPASADELAEIRQLLDNLDSRSPKKPKK